MDSNKANRTAGPGLRKGELCKTEEPLEGKRIIWGAKSFWGNNRNMITKAV